MKKIFFLTLVSFCFFTFGAAESFACSCILDEETPAEIQIKKAYEGAAAVFSGEVVEITKEPGDFNVKVKIKLEKSWKNKLSDEVIIRTGINDGLCGYEFEIGKKYLVYAYGEKDNLRTDICRRTASLSKNGDVIILDKIKKPIKTKSSPKPPRR